VNLVEDKNNFLQSKIEMFEKTNHTSTENYVCNIYDLMLKTELEMTEHTKEAHGNKENDIETVSDIDTESESSNLSKADEKTFINATLNLHLIMDYKSTMPRGIVPPIIVIPPVSSIQGDHFLLTFPKIPTKIPP
jgi:hypothetical protein